MKLKKIVAAIAAAAVAVSAMAINAFAIKDYPDGYTLDLIADGYDVTAVYGFEFKISGDIDSGVGGGVGFNSASTGWESHEWGNDDANKEIKASNGVVSVVKDAPVFQESDVTDPSNPYAQVWMQQWWGSDITVDSVTILGKDGVVLASANAPAEEATTEEAAAPAEETAEETAEEAPAEEEVAAPAEEEVVADEAPAEEAPAAEEAVEEAPAADAEAATAPAATGNTTAAVIVSVMAVAAAAAVVAKKRK